MNWKTDLHLSDLEADTRLEVTCRKCAASRYVVARDLMKLNDNRQARVDEIEARLRCSIRLCGGKVRIALGHNHKNEGFTGGLA